MEQMLGWFTDDIKIIYPAALRYGLAASLLVVVYFLFNGDQIFQFSSLRENNAQQDYWAFHAAAQSAANDITARLYDYAYFRSLFASETSLLWLYPPTMLIFLEPFGAIEYGHAKAIWVLSSVAGISAIVFYFSRGNWIITILAMLSPATFSVLYTGQFSVLFSALLAFGLMHSKTHPILAGLCLGLLSMKPQLGLLVPFFLIFTGAWRAFFVAALVTVLLVCWSIALYGIEAWVAFFDSLTNTHVNFMRSAPGNGRVALLDMANMAGFSTAVSFAIAGTAIVMSIPLLRSVVARGADVRSLAAFTITLTIATAPYVWAYEWVFILLAIVLFLGTKPNLENNITQGIVLLAWCVPLFPYVGVGFNYGLITWGSAAAMTYLIHDHMRKHEANDLNTEPKLVTQ